MDDKKLDVKDFLEFAYSFYKTMKDHDITLVFEGEITHQITKAFTSLIEQRTTAISRIKGRVVLDVLDPIQ